MSRIVLTEFISLDGVIEEPRWTFQFDRGPAGAKFKFDELFAADALLLGRVTYADLWISASTGQITLIGARSPAVQDYRFVSLEDISYPQAGVEGSSDEPVTVNTANYSGSTAFGTLRPEVGIDAEGTVYLSGAVARTSSGGTGANTVGTVPFGFRPHRDVYLITHTNFGTYADMVITPAGQINLIDPRPPLATDLSFVSLEGLSYQP